MTSKGGRSKKRHGRPGVAAASITPAAKPPRPHGAESSAGVTKRAASATPPVKPDRVPAGGTWSVPAWLMLASGLWSATVLWQLIRAASSADGAAGASPGPVIGAAAVAAVSSSVACWMLHRGSTGRVKVPLVIAAISGFPGIFSTVAALATLFLVRRANR